MRALLTNDDGIHAPGLRALYAATRDLFDDVMVVAPLTVQSATSHGITFHEPLMTSRIRIGDPDAGPGEGFDGISVDGRPADCTKLALTSLWPERYGQGTRPDLVISGMNMGANVGINVIYSGTVAAAIEAGFLGVPAIAVSQHLGRGTADFHMGAAHARAAIKAILDANGGSPPGAHEVLSLNIPRCEVEHPEHADPVELVACPMNTHALHDRYERRESPAGDAYYWPAGHGLDFHAADEGSDVAHLFERRTTLTPLHYDMTDRGTLSKWAERLAGK